MGSSRKEIELIKEKIELKSIDTLFLICMFFVLFILIGFKEFFMEKIFIYIFSICVVIAILVYITSIFTKDLLEKSEAVLMLILGFGFVLLFKMIALDMEISTKIILLFIFFVLITFILLYVHLLMLHWFKKNTPILYNKWKAGRKFHFKLP